MGPRASPDVLEKLVLLPGIEHRTVRIVSSVVKILSLTRILEATQAAKCASLLEACSKHRNLKTPQWLEEGGGLMLLARLGQRLFVLVHATKFSADL